MSSSPIAIIRNFISSAMPITAAYFIAFVILGIITSSLGPSLPELARLTGTQYSEISILLTTRSFGYLLGAILAGRLYDRVKGHPLMGMALLVIAITLSLVPVIPMLWVLAIVIMTIGIGEGLLDVGGNTLIVWLHGKKVSPFMNGLHFFFGVGAFLSPILIGQAILLSGGISGAYWLFAILVLPVSLWLLRLPSPQVPKAQHYEKTVPSMNYSLIWMIVLFMTLYVGAEVSFGSWIYTYGIENGISKVNAAYLNAVFWGAFTLSRLVSIPVSTRVRPSQMLTANFIGALISLILVFIWPDNMTLLWFATFVFGFSIAPVFPTMLTFAGNRMAITGRVTGYFFLGATVGGMFLPWFIGQCFEKVGTRFVIQVILVDMLLAAIVFAILFFVGRKRRQGW